MARWISLIITLVVGGCITIGCSGGGEIPVTPTAILELTKPNGGEQWVPGSTDQITWTSQNVFGTVSIEYSKDDFTSDVHSIAIDEPNDGTFKWNDIPLDPSTTVRVRVSSTEDPTICDSSDADFTIVGPWIEVLTPNGGEEWIHGTTGEITWTSEYITGTVLIEYSKDNFISDVAGIATDESNDGSFMWADIPFDVSDTVRVRVTSTDYPGVNDASDEDFRIVDFGWARTWGGGDSDKGVGLAVDESGSVYVTGRYVETVDFNPDGGDEHTSNGEWDVFLSKFDSAGNFEWVRTWGGPDYDEGLEVDIDSSGNVYVVGWFSETVDFNPTGGDPHTSNGSWDAFLSRFDSSGDLIWARTWGGTEGDLAFGVATDDAGDVYITGWFTGTVDFDSAGGDARTSAGDHDAYLSKFDSLGSFLWVRTWGGPGSDVGWEVATDEMGNAYVTGAFASTADFNPGAGDFRTSEGFWDVFLSKFSSAGNLQWARTWGGIGLDYGRGVSADDSGNVYATGYFSATVDFDPDGGSAVASEGSSDAFLSRFDSTGDFIWARTCGSRASDDAFGVDIDSLGNVYVAGTFRETGDFGSGGVHISNGEADIFLSRLDPSGNTDWTRTWGGLQDEFCLEIAVDSLGNAYVTGGYRDAVNFAPICDLCNDESDWHGSHPFDDAFLIKHLPDGCW